MQFITVGENKYHVAYTRPFSIITEEESVNIKNEYGYDIILKNNDSYYFCYKIDEAQIIEVPTVEEAVEPVLEESLGTRVDMKL